MRETLLVTIRTPHEVVFEGDVAALRFPTETGLAGLRPRGEPLVVALEPGLVILRRADRVEFAATAGGLLESGRRHCRIFTPFAAVGSSEEAMFQALEQALTSPAGELVARRRLGELEQRIVRELGERPAVSRRAARYEGTPQRSKGA
jgi:F0F1-type ATP synthase epsilon subunit